MRKINGKLFLALVIGLVVLVGGTFAVHHFQYQRIARALLFQARQAEDNKEPAEQAKYLQRYLDFNPRDQEETAHLARLWASDAYAPNSKQRRQSVALMDQVLAYKDDPELRRLLVKTALALRPADVRRASEHLQRLLPREELNKAIEADKQARATGEPLEGEFARPDRARGELESYWGLILEDGKDTVAALHCHRLAILHSPETQISYLRLAYLLRREVEADPAKKRANQDEADRVITLLVEKNKESHESHLTRWRYRRDFNLLRLRDSDVGRIELEDAAKDVTDALKGKPESVDVLLASADLERLRARAAAEDVRRPIADRRALLKEHRDRASRHLERGLEIITGNSAATTEYGRFQLLWHRANLLLDDLEVARAHREEDGKPPVDNHKLKDEIASVIDQIGRSQTPAAADYLRGRLQVHDMNWQTAAKLFEQARALLDEQPEMACQANLYLGQCYEKLEEHGQMYAAYQAVLKRDPSSLPATLGMARARALQGRLGEARALYQGALKEKTIPTGSWLDLTRLEIQIQLQNDRPNWDAVEYALKNAEKTSGPRGGVEVALLRYELLVRKNENEEAKRFLQTQLTLTPGEAELHAALVDSHLRQKELEKARAALEVGRREAGDRAGIRLAEARLLAVTKGKAGNAAIAALAAKSEKMPEEERSRLLIGLAEVLARNDDLGRARKVWQTLAELPTQKNNLRLRLLLFDMAMADGDEEGMKAVLADVRRVEQESGSYHRYGQALFLIRKAKITASSTEKADYLRRAEAELEQVRRQRSAWAPVNVALAAIAELKGLPKVALKQIEEAQNNGDNSTATTFKWAALKEKEDPEAARRAIEKINDKMMREGGFWRIRAGMQMRRGAFDEAITTVKEAIGQSKEPRDLVTLAGAYLDAWRKDGDRAKLDEASRLLDRAVELSSHDPFPYWAKVRFLVEQKQKKQAGQLVAVMEKKFSTERAAVELGLCYDLLGEPKKAIDCFDKAKTDNPGDARTYKALVAAHLSAGRSMRAEELLRALASGKMSGVPSTEVVEAQRKLAILLSAGTDFRRFSEALSLVGLSVDDQGRLGPVTDPETIEEQRTRARVLASQSNQKQFRAEAIRLFEKLRDKGPLADDDRFILARLYDVEGESRKSRDDLKQLVSSPSPNPRYLAHYAQLLITQKLELEEAERKIVLLEKLEKQTESGANGFGSVDLRVQLLEQQNKKDEALKLMQAHVAKKPEEVVLLINALCRQAKFSDAYEVCEKLWKEGKHTPEVLGAVSVGVLQGWKDASDAQIRAVEKHLANALARVTQQKKPSALLRLQLAQMHDKRGQYDQATDELRKVLEEQPNNVVALNNLAWMLALRSGDAGKALMHVEKAIAGMGRRADLLDTRAMVHLARKEPAKAVADLKEALQEGATASRLYRLARAHHENRESDKAKAALAQAKAKGLEVAMLHPVEHEEAKKLLAEYRLN